jgi:hypothetical protein
MRDLYQVPGVAETISLEQIKRHYYRSQLKVSPTGVVPVGPYLDFSVPHDRQDLLSVKEATNYQVVTSQALLMKHQVTE